MLKTSTVCQSHQHHQCISQALESAQEVCAQRGVRLTPLRKRVLELVWQSHKPLGAYDILEVLSREDGRRAAPPTVYRGLDFFIREWFDSSAGFAQCLHWLQPSRSGP